MTEQMTLFDSEDSDDTSPSISIEAVRSEKELLIESVTFLLDFISKDFSAHAQSRTTKSVVAVSTNNFPIASIISLQKLAVLS